MTKFILLMLVCSFDSYRDCSLYGYQHTVDILTKMPEKEIEKWRIHTRFSCKVDKTI